MSNEQLARAIQVWDDEQVRRRDLAWNTGRLTGIPNLTRISDQQCRDVLHYLLTNVSKADDVPGWVLGLMAGAAKSNERQAPAGE